MLSSSPPRYESQLFGGLQDFDRPSPNRVPTQSASDDAPPVMSIHDVGVHTPDRRPAMPSATSAQRAGFGFQQAPVATSPSYPLSSYAPVARSPLSGAPLGGPAFPSTALSENRSTVVVFGFPVSATALVLSNFRDHGEILIHVVDPDGNWMHIKYATRFSAQKALSKNGTVMQGGLGQSKFMVGVMEASAEKDDELSSQLDTTQPMAMSGFEQDRLPGGIWDAPSQPLFSTPRAANGGLQPVGMRLNAGTSSGTGLATPSRALPQAALANTSEQPQAGSNGGLLNKVGDWLLGWN